MTHDMKQCLTGHEEFVWNFGRDASRDDGLNRYCKGCVNQRSVARRDEMRANGLSTRMSYRTVRYQPKFPPQVFTFEPEPIEPEQEVDNKQGLSEIAIKALWGRCPKRFRSAWMVV